MSSNEFFRIVSFADFVAQLRAATEPERVGVLGCACFVAVCLLSLVIVCELLKFSFIMSSLYSLIVGTIPGAIVAFFIEYLTLGPYETAVRGTEVYGSLREALAFPLISVLALYAAWRTKQWNKRVETEPALSGKKASYKKTFVWTIFYYCVITLPLSGAVSR